MSEPKKEMSRRDFLKLAGMGVAALAIKFGLAPESSNGSEGEPTYFTIEHNSAVGLIIDGKSEFIHVSYLNPGVTELKVRQMGDKPQALSFEKGEKRIRMLGEITDPNLRPIKDVKEGTYIHWPLDGLLRKDVGHYSNLTMEEGLYAVGVIGPATGNLNEKDVETNARRHNSEVRNLTQFSNSAAVGTFDGETFLVKGYVLDVRNLELA